MDGFVIQKTHLLNGFFIERGSSILVEIFEFTGLKVFIGEGLAVEGRLKRMVLTVVRILVKGLVHGRFFLFPQIFVGVLVAGQFQRAFRTRMEVWVEFS